MQEPALTTAATRLLDFQLLVALDENVLALLFEHAHQHTCTHTSTYARTHRHIHNLYPPLHHSHRHTCTLTSTRACTHQTQIFLSSFEKHANQRRTGRKHRHGLYGRWRFRACWRSLFNSRVRYRRFWVSEDKENNQTQISKNDYIFHTHMSTHIMFTHLFASHSLHLHTLLTFCITRSTGQIKISGYAAYQPVGKLTHVHVFGVPYAAGAPPPSRALLNGSPTNATVLFDFNTRVLEIQALTLPFHQMWTLSWQ